LVKLDKSTIHRAILESGTIPVVDAQEIEKISAQYPFFNTAQVLLSKVYQKAGDHRFIDQLNQAAMYSIDRKILHRYIHSSLPEENKIEDTVIQNSLLSIETDKENIVAEQEENITPSFNPELVSNPDAISDAIIDSPEEFPEKIISAEKTSEQEIDELVNSILDGEAAEQPHALSSNGLSEKMAELPSLPVEFTPDPASNSFESKPQTIDSEIAREENNVIQNAGQNLVDTDEALDQEILLEAIRSSIEIEVSETEAEEGSREKLLISDKIKADITEQKPVVPEIVVSDSDRGEEQVQTYADWIYRRSQQIHFSDSTQKPVEDENAVPDMATDWLREETFSEKIEEKTIPSEPEIALIPEIEEKEQTTLSHGVTRIEKPDKKTHQRDLVDRFIKKDPRITPGKSVDYLPGNLFKDSLEEDYEFMTETIAQLLARQGKFDKARKAYRKLIEQHPEKSVYFAAQLKNLDRLKKP
jgi:hypothetical protein